MRLLGTFGSLITALLLGVALAWNDPASVTATCGVDLFISEYVEGSASNQALEIFNGTAGAIDLGANSVAIDIYSNGSASISIHVPLSGTVASNDVFVVARVDLPVDEDQISATMVFNGDDAIVLRANATVVDVIGQTAFDPGTAWGSGGTTTMDHTLRRKPQFYGDTVGTDVFDPATEWDWFAQDVFTGLGAHTANPCIASVGGVSESVQRTTLLAPTSPAPGSNVMTYGLAGLIALLGVVGAGACVAWRRRKAILMRVKG